MTFYWWSHWFWITALATAVSLLPYVVEAYPGSQPQAATLTHAKRPEPATKPVERVTRLYQTPATMPWSSGKLISGVGGSGSGSGSEHIMVLTNAGSSRHRRGKEIALVGSVPIGVLQYERKRSADIVSGLNVGRSSDNLKVLTDGPLQRNADSKEQPAEAATELSELMNFSNEKSYFSTKSNSSKLGSRKPCARLLLHPTATAGTITSMKMVTLATKRAEPETTTMQESADVNDATRASILRSDRSEEEYARSALSRDLTETVRSPSMFRTAAAAVDRGVPTGVNVNTKTDALTAKTSTATEIITRKFGSVPFILGHGSKEDEPRYPESTGEQRSRKSKVLSAEYKHINRFINYSSDSKNVLQRSAATAANDLDSDGGNISSEALAIQRASFMDAGTVSVIGLAIVGICCTVGSLGIVLYRRRYINKPQTLSEPDSSVYIDDSIIRVYSEDNSDEMYSLDNDSFLNSLEAMTIQNYWTDTVKHTKL